jgi:hypothetical protein
MFNQILTAFKGFFSRSFWFASFLPVATIAALHIAIAEMAFPGLIPVRKLLDADVGEKLSAASLFVAALVVLAYTLAPLTPLFRDMLDGRSLWPWLHNLLRTARIADWQRAKSEMQAASRAYGRFDSMYRKQIPKISGAAEAGNKLAKVMDAASIKTAAEATRALQTQMQSSRLPDFPAAQDAVDKLVLSLQQNASNLNDENSKLLDGTKELLIALIDDARAEAAYHRGMISSKNRIDLLPTRLDLLPTRVGDARRITERYSEDTYYVHFDYVWTRIEMLLPKDDTSFLQRLGDAQSQVGFSVLALLLTFSVPLVWLPILVVCDTTPWLFLGIGVLSPALVLFLYELVVQSQSVFGEVVRAAIDKYRLNVLSDVMRQPLPTTLAAERALWRGLALASEPGNEVNASLSHKATTVAPAS